MYGKYRTYDDYFKSAEESLRLNNGEEAVNIWANTFYFNRLLNDNKAMADTIERMVDIEKGIL